MERKEETPTRRRPRQIDKEEQKKNASSLHKVARKTNMKGNNTKVLNITGQPKLKSFLELKSKEQGALSFKNSGTIVHRQNSSTLCKPATDCIDKTTTEAENCMRDPTQLNNTATQKNTTMDTIG